MFFRSTRSREAAWSRKADAGVRKRQDDGQRDYQTDAIIFRQGSMMSAAERVAIVTGASQGINAGRVRELLVKGYRVVASSRKILATEQPDLVEVAGDISGARNSLTGHQDHKRAFWARRHPH